MICREYNELVKSCKEEVEEMKEVQAKSMQEQQHLDEESLQRIKSAEEAKKVVYLPKRVPVPSSCL